MCSRCLHNMVNFGPLAAEISLPVWGTPANFNGFRILAALLHGSQVVSISQTLQRSTEGATYVRQGPPSRWALAHILVDVFLHVYLNVYYASDSVCCIISFICPHNLIMQFNQLVLLPAASVRPRVVQSATCPVRELAICEVSS